MTVFEQVFDQLNDPAEIEQAIQFLGRGTDAHT